MSRFLKHLTIVLVLLLAGALLITGSQVSHIFTEKILSPLTEWEIDSVSNNYIGFPITIVFRVSISAKAQVDLSLLPEVGETVDLWRILPPTPFDQGFEYYDNPTPGLSPNGEFEVQNRVIREHFRGGQRIIEATYTFLYLDPIDFKRQFTEKVTRSPNVHIRYILFIRGTGRFVREFVNTTSKDATFYLVRRVKEGDQPIPDLLAVAKVVSPLPHYFRLIAAGLMVGMLSAQSWSVVNRRILRRRGSKLALVSPASFATAELYESWQKNGDYQYFLEAVRLYREGFWGRPRPLDWARTTFILYSGWVISASQIKKTFEYLISLDVGKAVEEVQSEPVP
jgi:hypothetical protein